jgi:hypothetical protein
MRMVASSMSVRVTATSIFKRLMTPHPTCGVCLEFGHELIEVQAHRRHLPSYRSDRQGGREGGEGGSYRLGRQGVRDTAVLHKQGAVLHTLV